MYFARVRRSIKLILNALAILGCAFVLQLSKAAAFSVRLPTSVNAVSNDSINLKPGDTLFVQAGEKEFLTLRNFQGTKETPICIVNQGGQVTINSHTDVYHRQGINIKNCQYLKLLGNGDTDFPYGFEIVQTQIGSGIDIREGSGAIELAHIEVHHTQFAGIIAKDDPDCEGRYLRNNHSMKALYFHHNYIHHTGGEGMYIGHTSYAGQKLYCNGIETLLYPHLIEAVEVSHNRFVHIGREAIQVFSAPKNVRIQHNEVIRYATNQEQSHSNAITLGLGTSGEASQNRIVTGYGHGMALTGGSWYLHNNLVSGAGMLRKVVTTTLACGVYVDQGTLSNGAQIAIANNTIVRSKHNGVRLVANGAAKQIEAPEVFAWNNLLADCGNGVPLFDEKDTATWYFWNPAGVRLSANLEYEKMQAAGFVNPLKTDFRLREDAEAINAGALMHHGSWAMAEQDMEGKPRRVGSRIDIGAFEYPKVLTTDGRSGIWNCREVFYPGRSLLDGEQIEHGAGDTFCLAQGDWSLLQVRNFSGSEEAPVVFMPARGHLSFEKRYVGLRLEGLKHVHFTRNEVDSSPWYFKDIQGDAVVIENCEDLQLSHFKMESIGNYGVKLASSNPKLGLQEPNATEGFEMCHSSFLNGRGRWAIYIAGHPQLSIKNVNLYHNHFEGQAGGAISCVFVDDGLRVWKNDFSEILGTSLHFDACEELNLFANELHPSQESLLEVLGVEKAYVHNNVLLSDWATVKSLIVLKNSQYDFSGYVDFQLVNNTILLQGQSALENRNTYWKEQDCHVFNNLAVRQDPSILVFTGISSSNNLFISQNMQAEFVDFEKGDFRLKPQSMARSIGLPLAMDFMRVDFLLLSREGAVDMGAFSSSEEIVPKFSESPAEIQLYPNPSVGNLHVQLPSATAIGQVSYNILDPNGIPVVQGQMNHRGTELQLQDLNSGVYLLEVGQGDERLVQPFVIQKQ